MKRFLTCFLTLTLCLSLPTSAFAAKTFSDVPRSHWAYQSVNTAVERGWVKGMTDTQYQPSGSVTGAQFLTMVVRAFYPGDISAGVADPWYQPYVDAGDEHGLRDGAGLTSAKALNAPLTRYQMAVIMDNVLIDAGINAPAHFGPAVVIGDWPSIPAAYQNAVARTYALGLLTGMDDRGTFAGTSGMTRAQAAVVMCRMGDLIPVQSPGTDPITPADMVSNQALLNQANARVLDQYYFLYGLRAGAVFTQDWTVAFETDEGDDWPVQWFRVTQPGINSYADVEEVWYSYFAKAWPLDEEYLANYLERNGKLYTCNPGIGDDPTFQTIKVVDVLTREQTYATLVATAYYYDPWRDQSYTENYYYDMKWEDGQWKCAWLGPMH